MKLNPDSVRAVLLYIEEKHTLDNNLSSCGIARDILKESGCVYGFEEDLEYAIKQLHDNGMINAIKISVTNSGIPNYIILDITPSGHEFLANIHSNDVWEKTKAKAKIVGSWSLQALSLIAKQLILNAINNP